MTKEPGYGLTEDQLANLRYYNERIAEDYAKQLTLYRLGEGILTDEEAQLGGWDDWQDYKRAFVPSNFTEDEFHKIYHILGDDEEIYQIEDTELLPGPFINTYFFLPEGLSDDRPLGGYRVFLHILPTVKVKGEGDSLFLTSEVYQSIC
ncbi:hypothetical protein LCGC14_0347630 [marine sediment metagenome]|uniref:Uncharacterized protein n=1 Tax=marine sediment metagenome TaxID=412755 RepID=A0A0F9VZ72_9ZZZZ